MVPTPRYVPGGDGCGSIGRAAATIVSTPLTRPVRVLVGLENRLKRRERIEEKVMHDEQYKGTSSWYLLLRLTVHPVTALRAY